MLATVPTASPDGVDVGDDVDVGESATDVGESATDVGDCAAKALPDTVAELVTYPLRAAVTLTVAEPDADNPDTVNGNTDPEPEPATTEPASTDGVHDQPASQFVTFTVNPSAVRTGESNAGVRAPPRTTIPLGYKTDDCWTSVVWAEPVVDIFPTTLLPIV